MAIAEMKKLTLLGLNRDKHRLLKALQRLSCVEIMAQDATEERSAPELEDRRAQELSQRIARLDLAISRLSAFDPNKPGLLSVRPEAGDDQVAAALGASGEIMEAVDRLEEIERTRGELRTREAREKALIAQLAPWEALDVPLEEIAQTRSAEVLLVTIPLRGWPVLEQGCARLNAVSVQQVPGGREAVNALIALHKSEAEALDALLREAGAVRVHFEGLTGTAALLIDQANGRLARLDEVRAQLTEEVRKLAEHLPLMRLLRDIEAAERDRVVGALKCVNTQSAFLLTGWLPANRQQVVEAAIKKIAPICELRVEDPAEGEQPPTLMVNRSYVRPFESIVKMFSMPDPNGFDPTFIMMPFWVCFFGMMVSDAAYGIILGVAACYIYVKLKGRGIGQMAFILALGGLSTVFWGAMYGGWFSIEGIPALLLVPMEDPIGMLALCMGLGALHLFTGLGVAAYMNIRRGKPVDALLDQGSWMILLIGLGLLAVSKNVGMALSIAGAAGIILFAKRDKPNFFKRILGGLGTLYGVSGYLSDLLSYARLFGMGLATGVIGMVFNTLAGMMWGSPAGSVAAILILVVGHTFNLFINALGAYVHSCRLQFIEFFGKFYEMGGRDFSPLAVNGRYVDIRGEQF